MSLIEATLNLTTTTFYSTLTTHSPPPLSHVSPLVGYILIFVCVIFWGIMFLPVKHYGNTCLGSLGLVFLNDYI